MNAINLTMAAALAVLYSVGFFLLMQRSLMRVLLGIVVLDDERRLSFVNFGEVISSHAEAVAHVRSYAEVAIPRQFPLVVTSGAGNPLDKTYYQTIKGMVAALPALQPGGTMVIASECSEKMGSEEFCEAQRELTGRGVNAFLEAARKREFASIDEWQTVKLTEALRKGRVHLFAPGLGRENWPLTGVACHAGWEEALSAACAESGANEALVIPEGPYVSPVYRPAAAGLP